MKRKFHIEWSTLVPRQEGWDEIEAETVGEVRRIYAERYPRRYIYAISVVTPVAQVAEFARVE